MSGLNFTVMAYNENLPDIECNSPEEALRWTWDRFGTKAVFTSSFGAEDMVIMDMMSRLNVEITVATLDTGRLPEETYELIEKASEKYGVRVLSYFPERKNVENMVREKGMNLFYRSVENRKECCYVRKVEPLGRLLQGREAWVTGLRSDQTDLRKGLGMVGYDSGKGLVKINPLINWSAEDVWAYIREHEVPYSALHDMGFPSIGCEPCTRAIKPGESERAGRWWWERDVKECGLHVDDTSGKGPSARFSVSPEISGNNEVSGDAA